jgi:hypothetical protein
MHICYNYVKKDVRDSKKPKRIDAAACSSICAA